MMRAGIVIATVILIATAVAIFSFVSNISDAFVSVTDEVALKGIPKASRSGMFEVAWQLDLQPRAVSSMTVTPQGWPGDLAVLPAGDTIHILRRDGTAVRTIDAPDNTEWIGGDPTGAIPFLVAVSRDYRIGLDRLVKTSFVHALDVSGRVLWTRTYAANRMQPGLTASLATSGGMPVILVVSGTELICLDVQGRALWTRPFQRASHLNRFTGVVNGQEPEYAAVSLAARERMAIEQNGRRLEIPWSGYSFRLLAAGALFPGGPTEVALSRHYNRTGGGTGVALTFVQLPFGTTYETATDGDAAPVAIEPFDTDADGMAVWLSASTDGSLRVIPAAAPSELVEYTGARFQYMAMIPGNPPVIVAATHRGLAAWRPSTALIGRYE